MPTLSGTEKRYIVGVVEDLKHQIRKAEQHYKKRKEYLETKIVEIQNRCTHEHTEYFPDASGNNDSSTYCIICQKYLGR